jgi:aspartate carbamoyltransferase regulatory subunit
VNIYRGIVLDHLPSWKGPGLLETLGLEGTRAGLLLGQTSARMGKKDILIVAEHELGEVEEQRLALYAPDSTLNFIDKGKVVRKKRPRLPEVLHQLLVCINPRCITRAEEVPHKILNPGHGDSSLQCHYCQHSFLREEAEFV